MKKCYLAFLVLIYFLTNSCDSSKTKEVVSDSAISSEASIDTSKKDAIFAKDKPLKNDKTADIPNTLKKLQGTWVDEEDTLSFLNIKGTTWIFGYGEEPATPDEKYKITITDKLPKFANETVKAEFVILINEFDTLNYELNGFTPETVSLTYLPKMSTAVYKRKK